MPDNKLPLVAITLSSGTAANRNNAQIIITDRNTGESQILSAEGASQIVVDLNNFDTAPSEGDVFTVVAIGAVIGGTSFTLTGRDTQSVSLTVADYTPPVINM